MVSPILRSRSISDSRAPPWLMFRARARWEKGRPSAPMPQTRRSRSTGIRGGGGVGGMGAEMPVIEKLRTVHDSRKEGRTNGYGSASGGVSPSVETDIAINVSTVGKSLSTVQFQP